MICSKESNIKLFVGVFLVVSCFSCKSELPEIPPSLITEKTPFDTDDPAIWVNTDNPEHSIVFGTDKDELNGGVYAFDLNGKIIKEKSITGLAYPNNIDVAYHYKINDSTFKDVLLFTEREKHQIRLFSLPDMKPLDQGGLPVFNDEKDLNFKRPMGIAAYTDMATQKTYVIVSRKEGSKNNYLEQYQLVANSLNETVLVSVRTFGDFSGKKEIEAVAVDEDLGFVYYSDEDHCIRKYYADPRKGNAEISCFGSEHFKRDIEGIAIAKYQNNEGYIIVSDQQNHSFSVFDRKTNAFIKSINLGTTETDGCDVTTTMLGSKFPNGLFVSMTDSKEFYYHDLKSLGLE